MVDPRITASLNQPPASHQATDDDLRSHLAESIIRVHNALQKWRSTVVHTSGGAVTDTFRGQGRALALLATRGTMPQREMSDALGIRPQSLGETLVKLEHSGYITRHPSETDHRALVVEITDAGRALVNGSTLALPFTTFTTDELSQLIALIERATSDIEAQTRLIKQAGAQEA